MRSRSFPHTPLYTYILVHAFSLHKPKLRLKPDADEKIITRMNSRVVYNLFILLYVCQIIDFFPFYIIYRVQRSERLIMYVICTLLSAYIVFPFTRVSRNFGCGAVIWFFLCTWNKYNEVCFTHTTFFAMMKF